MLQILNSQKRSKVGSTVPEKLWLGRRRPRADQISLVTGRYLGRGSCSPAPPWGALRPKLVSCACVRALAPPHWRRRRSHFAAASERVAVCFPGVSLRKAAAPDGPKRAVLSGTRRRTPVGKRRPCHPLGAWDPALL